MTGQSEMNEVYPTILQQILEQGGLKMTAKCAIGFLASFVAVSGIVFSMVVLCTLLGG